MPVDPCATRGPLSHAGSTQSGRQKPALDTAYFRPDERDIADLILFGQRFSKYLQYYNSANSKSGDWSAFFTGDVAAALAALSKLPIEEFRQQQSDLEHWLSKEPGRPAAELEAHAKLGFHVPILLLEQAALSHEKLPIHHTFRAPVTQLFQREFEEPVTDIASWYKGALDVSGPGTEVLNDTAPLPSDYNLDGAPADTRLRLSDRLASALQAGLPKFSEHSLPAPALAKFAHQNWADLYVNSTPDPSPYVDAATAPNRHYEQIYDLLNYNLYQAALERIYSGLIRIRSDAVLHLQAALTDFANHTPHYGLWLAFLQVYEHAKADLNQFSDRHMRFYFRDILRIANLDAFPDQAHLIFELSKGTDTHLLKADTLFDGGKDAFGEPVSYGLDHDIVVNTGTVAQLRAIQIDAEGPASNFGQTPYAATEIRSRDGLGEIPLAPNAPAFSPFGPVATPKARVGFAVTDKKMFLREGQRTITLRAILKSPLPTTAITPRWRIRLTGEEDWFEISGTSQISTLMDNSFLPETAPPTGAQYHGPQEYSQAKKGAQKDTKKIADKGQKAAHSMTSNPWDATQHHAGKHTGSNTFGSNQTENEPATTPVPILEITITLGPDDPAIVPLTHKLHGTDHAEGLPTAEILFDFDAPTTPRAFAVLRDIQFDHLLVQAQADRIKNLKILADGAEVDSAKPFEPFGTRPRIGTPFHIGSSEIFSKSIKTWKLHLEWENPYYTSGYFYSHSASIYNPTEWVLTGGKWELADPPKTVTTSEGYSYSTLAGEADLKINYSVVDVELASGELIDGQAEQFIENPGLDSKSRNGFLRMSLPADFGHNLFSDHKAMALVAKAGGDAYAKPSWVNVSSTSTLPNEPFVPVLSAISASYVTNLETAQSHSLLYPFGQTSGTSDRRLFPEFPYESALCIGIDAFNAPARLNLLVQVLDGSGDPLIPSPPLGFEYLSDTGWQKLLPQDVDDKTANFTTSAVLGLNLPEVLNRSYPEMPTDLYWVRISSQENSAAMNQLLQITAQAAVVSFRDTGNDPMFLATPLPAGTIAKPKIPDPLVKKITQPFSSFGGRPAEPDATFYTRVSERLRHKDRAITIWDYEALVLQQFPKLFRAKCLPTTALKRDAQSRIIADNENMPGAVTLVTVPWTHDQNSRDPLRPYTDQATLHAVDTFLRQRISPFVRLEVQNPKFEEIQLQFNVRFRPEIGDIAFYTEELNKALVAYLSPWSQPEGGEITFGGNLWKSSVIDFVDEWPHVDFVTDFQMFHKVDVAAPDGSWTPIDSEVIEATTARSILVSAASHKINEVPGNG